MKKVEVVNVKKTTKKLVRCPLAEATHNGMGEKIVSLKPIGNGLMNVATEQSNNSTHWNAAGESVWDDGRLHEPKKVEQYSAYKFEDALGYEDEKHVVITLSVEAAQQLAALLGGFRMNANHNYFSDILSTEKNHSDTLFNLLYEKEIRSEEYVNWVTRQGETTHIISATIVE